MYFSSLTKDVKKLARLPEKSLLFGYQELVQLLLYLILQVFAVHVYTTLNLDLVLKSILTTD